MKTEYTRPSIEVAALASATPIASKTCVGDNKDDWEHVQTWLTDEEGKTYVHHQWVKGVS